MPHNKISAADLYPEAVKTLPANHISHWCSDLYLRVSPESKNLIDRYEFRNLVRTFTDQIDHQLWYEIPFAAPFRV